jgi:hypothetical protein
LPPVLSCAENAYILYCQQVTAAPIPFQAFCRAARKAAKELPQRPVPTYWTLASTPSDINGDDVTPADATTTDTVDAVASSSSSSTAVASSSSPSENKPSSATKPSSPVASVAVTSKLSHAAKEFTFPSLKATTDAVVVSTDAPSAAPSTSKLNTAAQEFNLSKYSSQALATMKIEALYELSLKAFSTENQAGKYPSDVVNGDGSVARRLRASNSAGFIVALQPFAGNTSLSAEERTHWALHAVDCVAHANWLQLKNCDFELALDAAVEWLDTHYASSTPSNSKLNPSAKDFTFPSLKATATTDAVVVITDAPFVVEKKPDVDAVVHSNKLNLSAKEFIVPASEPKTFKEMLWAAQVEGVGGDVATLKTQIAEIHADNEAAAAEHAAKGLSMFDVSAAEKYFSQRHQELLEDDEQTAALPDVAPSSTPTPSTTSTKEIKSVDVSGVKEETLEEEEVFQSVFATATDEQLAAGKAQGAMLLNALMGNAPIVVSAPASTFIPAPVEVLHSESVAATLTTEQLAAGKAQGAMLLNALMSGAHRH